MKMRVRLYNLFLLNKFYSKNSVHFLHSLDKNELEKKCAQEIRQVKVPQLALPPTGTSPNWHIPQLALPPTGPRPRLKSPNCRYTKKFNICYI